MDDAELVGIVRAPLAFLKFPLSRQEDETITSYLAGVFDDTKCRPEHPDNQIPALVRPEEFDEILSKINITANDLRKTLEFPEYPLVYDHQFTCLDGMHRVSAARSSRKASWWVLKLYRSRGMSILTFVCSDSLTNEVIPESYSHQSTYSDGHIYRMVRKYMNENGMDDVVKWWKARLKSDSKKRTLKALLKRAPIVQALDHLLEYGGLIDGLQLGNMHKHFATHCDEQILKYIEYIQEVWNFITDGNPILKPFVDLKSIRRLERRAPKVCCTDSHYIRLMFADGTLFSQVSNPNWRDGMLRKILSLDVIIPSLETFHHNMIYLSIGMKILRGYLLDPLTNQPKKPKLDEPTTYQRMISGWEPPHELYISKDEFEDTQVHGPPDPYLAFQDVLLVAFRHFPWLHGLERPRYDGEIISPEVRDCLIGYLASVAYKRGFRSQKITANLEKVATRHERQQRLRDGRLLDWRSGTPYTETHVVLMSQAYLPCLTHSDKLADLVLHGDNPSPAFCHGPGS